MSGIFPDAMFGGVIIRNTIGVGTNPPGVVNAYVPPSTFVSTCQITALPSDCVGRFAPQQMNAIQSELLALAVALNPSGTWNCGSVNNLAAGFAAWSNTPAPGGSSKFMASPPAP